jgi:hypothetical protein
MRDLYPLMRSLDPHHQRIGYLGALTTVISRGLDSHEALAGRYHDLIFERVYPDDSRFDVLFSRLDSDQQKALLGHKRGSEEDPSSILSSPADKAGWVYLSEFWIRDRSLPSHIGWLGRDKYERTIQLARWGDLLLQTNELSETGYVLRVLLDDTAGESSSPTTFNLLNPSARPCLPLLYLRIMLGAEILFPFVVSEFVERDSKKIAVTSRGESGLLRAALDRAIEVIGEPSDPDDILAIREWLTFREVVLKNLSTEENYLRPRLEILVDLGIVGRRKNAGPKGFIWEVTHTTRSIVEEWQELIVDRNSMSTYLETQFFGSVSRVWGGSHRPATGDEERLLWFARALRRVRREFGFTPGRTAALLGCLLSWESGIVIELSEMFDVVYRAAKSEWGKYLHFSGGSRFDREFLIRMDDEALERLENSVWETGRR